MVPGDSSTGYSPVPTGQTDAQTAACTFDIDYVGTAPAYIGVEELSGGTGLYDGSANGLQYQIKDNNSVSFANGALQSGILFVSSDLAGTTHHKFTVNYALPRSADNAYQGLNATLSLKVYAVQSGNNSVAGTPGSPAPAGIAWS
jgi:hypothetical protein